jgi:hypothetical protein
MGKCYVLRGVTEIIRRENPVKGIVSVARDRARSIDAYCEIACLVVVVGRCSGIRADALGYVPERPS